MTDRYDAQRGAPLRRSVGILMARNDFAEARSMARAGRVTRMTAGTDCETDEVFVVMVNGSISTAIGTEKPFAAIQRQSAKRRSSVQIA